MKTSDSILEERRQTWKSKKILLRLYSRWYKLISGSLRPGKTLELGGGSGNLKDFFPDTISSDIVFAPWLDTILDAHNIPLKDETLDNIVLFDVLHHMIAPSEFLMEAERVLKPEGRIIMIEPYVSWASFFIYRFLHAEGMKWHINPFRLKVYQDSKDPFSGNQAIPTLIFEKFRSTFEKKFRRLKILQKKHTDSIIFPLSGGFHNPSLCPITLWSLFENIEKVLQPLSRILSFRLFIVLEKSRKTG